MHKSSLITVAATLGAFLFTSTAHAEMTQKVEIVNSNARKVKTAHCQTYDGKVYVSGLVARPSAPAGGAHVDVRLVDAKGKTIQMKSSNVAITGNPSTNKTASYTVSFDPADFAKADHAQVSFSGSSHSYCTE